jgi:hypothetical protein
MGKKCRKINILFWFLLTSAATIDNDGTKSQSWRPSTTAATAFPLASIFPRRAGMLRSNDQVTSSKMGTQICRDVRNEQLKELKKNGVISESDGTVVSEQPAQLLPNGKNGGSRLSIISGNTSGESVHLQLRSIDPVPAPVDEDSEDNQSKQDAHGSEESPEQPKTALVRVHTFLDPQTKRTWVALNTSRRKFRAFLDYNNVTMARNMQSGNNNCIIPQISTTTVSLPDENCGSQRDPSVSNTTTGDDLELDCAIRKHWRGLWKSRQLLTDRTELLAVYHSDQTKENNSSEKHASNKKRRGGFTDILNLYTNRLVAILRDEQQDEQTPLDERFPAALFRAQQKNRYGQPISDGSLILRNNHKILVRWLEDNYGISETQMLQKSRLRSLPTNAQLAILSHFLRWFKNRFPYYYDRCDACGASRKDDLASHPQPQSSESTHVSDDDGDDGGSFLGYIYPSTDEVKGKASRTELYHCHKCGSFTRFPRFNSAFDIIQSRRGRCGEYSLLLYRFLRALNHDVRWIVDWSDHVWAEVLIDDNNERAKDSTTSDSARWVHLDPCESAVDEPLLYQGWGKKQTYIIALYAPLRYQALQSQSLNGFSGIDGTASLSKSSLVEDVTQQYTNDSWETICKRRDESQEEVATAIEDAVAYLEKQLLKWNEPALQHDSTSSS